MDIKLIKYQDVLEKLEESDNENHLLLGNGFNYSLGVNTGYENIFNKMKELYSGYSDLQIEDNNYDIEKLIGLLKEQLIIDGSQKEFLEKFINNKVKSDFMKATYKIVKDCIKNIYQKNNEGLGVLFKNFTNYFSLNYDPLLYLMLMKYKKTDTVISFRNTTLFEIDDINVKDEGVYKDIKKIYETHSKKLTDEEGNIVIDKPLSKLTKTDFEKQLREILKAKNLNLKQKYIDLLYDELNEGGERKLSINDGFSKQGQMSLFKCECDISKSVQNVFFLHGVFHIYKDKKSIYKITQKQDKALYNRLEEILNSEDKDIVCVFTNDNKKEEIEGNSYLKKGIESLKRLQGSIVIIGSSLDNNDNHIFDSINSSGINTVYYSSNCKEKENDKKKLEELFSTKEIILFDRETISYEPQKPNPKSDNN